MLREGGALKPQAVFPYGDLAGKTMMIRAMGADIL
jgi:hypothetical protein